MCFKMALRQEITCLFFIALFSSIVADHFLGGTVSWKAVANLTNVLEIKYKLSYTIHGLFSPICKKVGGEVSSIETQSKWQCFEGCNNPNETLNPAKFKCLMVDKENSFQQFGDTFTKFVLDNNMKKTIGFAGEAWRVLNVPKPSGPTTKKELPWNIQTLVDTRRRSDTHLPNSSPETLSRPMYDLRLNHRGQIQLPVIDADGDEVRCRWATPAECAGSCYTLPGAKLKGCTLSLKPTTARHYVAGGWYLVALMLEDFPRRSDVRLAGDAAGVRSSPLSSVPLQFMLRVLPPDGASNRPVILSPPDGARYELRTGEPFIIDLYAQSKVLGARIAGFTVQAPHGIQQGSVTQVTATVAYIRVEYKRPVGSNNAALFCFTARDSLNANSDTNCVTMITISTDHCRSAPCLNKGRCTNHQLSYSCVCPKNFSGYNCEMVKTSTLQRTSSSFTLTTETKATKPALSTPTSIFKNITTGLNTRSIKETSLMASLKENQTNN